VLSRKPGYPELIFNQDPRNDKNHKIRHFEKDHEAQWKFDPKKPNSCYVCEKQKYTMIFYD